MRKFLVLLGLSVLIGTAWALTAQANTVTILMDDGGSGTVFTCPEGTSPVSASLAPDVDLNLNDVICAADDGDSGGGGKVKKKAGKKTKRKK